jgi:tetratricopeptide (TPR) repeat protein
MEAVHRYEGTVNQVMGDGIMALFGAPLAHEDHAVRACYAALRMQAAIERYSEGVRRAQGVRVQIRVGLNSGEVVVRAISNDLHMDYTALGQTTHLAARMEQLATPGSILITERTIRLAEGYIQVAPLGLTPVKGLTEPVEIYEVKGAGPVRSRFQAAAARGLTRFVGREAEVEHLRRVLERAGAGAGHGQVVAIVGEAGVGKSRLVYEFTHSHRVQDWLILEAASVSYGKATSYLPVIDLLKGYFKIGDRDDHREMRDKVLGRVLGLDRALEPLLTPLLALLDVPVEHAAWQNLDPPQRRQRTLDAVKRLLLRESQVQPLLVVFEDLHWIDGETQALLDSFVESLGSARLLLLVNYRPEYEHRWGSKTAYSQLRLDSLPAEDAAELLAVLLGPDSGLAPLRQMLVKRGNPFFLEETVRTLVETGALAGERGAYRLTRPVEALQMPATVQTILAARIDRLPAEEKQLLQAASVIGKDVPYGILAAIAERPEEALRRELGHLQEAEFLYETRLFPDFEYTFKHALTHEVTYGSLLGERRRQLHARIVAAMEHLYADRLGDHTERLGQHALRGEVWEKAAGYLHQAGVKAYDRSANREAVALLEQALGAVEHLPAGRETRERAVDLRLSLSAPVSTLGDLDRALAILGEAERVARELDDLRRLGWVSGALAAIYVLRAEYARAIEHGERGLESGQLTGEAGVQVVSAVYLAMSHHFSGRLPRAVGYYRQALALLEGERPRERYGMRFYPRSYARAVLALCLAQLGEFGEAIRYAQEAQEIAEEVEHAFTRSNALHLSALAYWLRGDLDRAIQTAEQAVRFAQEANSPVAFVYSAGSLGSALTEAGRALEAIPLLEQVVETAVKRQIKAGLGRLEGVLADAYARLGRRDEAPAWARRALDTARAQSALPEEVLALRLLGEIHAHGEPAGLGAAEDWYRQALTLATELGMRPLVAHCHLGLGKLYRRTGQREQADEHLTMATTMYREMDMRFWLEKAVAEVAGLA